MVARVTEMSLSHDWHADDLNAHDLHTQRVPYRCAVGAPSVPFESQPPIMTVGHPGGSTLPTGLGIGAT